MSSASAPVDETMRFSSISMPFSFATSEPVAITMFLVSSVCVLPSLPFTSTLPAADDAAGAAEGIDLVLLEQEIDALDVAVDALSLNASIAFRSSFGLPTPMPIFAKLWPASSNSFGGVQQRLRGNAADIEAGAAMGGAFLDHRHFHAELRRADGADIAAGAGADDNEIVGHEQLRTLDVMTELSRPSTSHHG